MNAFQRYEYMAALRARKIDVLLERMDKTTLPLSCSCRIFEVLFNSRSKKAHRGLRILLNHPDWNPNYQTPDMLFPEERAMLHNRQEIAIGIIQHPNFDKARMPRVIQAAKQFHAGWVLNIANQMQNQNS